MKICNQSSMDIVTEEKNPSYCERKLGSCLEVFRGLGPRCGGKEVIPFNSKEKSSWVRVGLVALTLIVGLAFLIMGILALSLACSGPLTGITTGLVFGCSLGSMVLGVLLLSLCCEWGIKLCGKKIIGRKEEEIGVVDPAVKDPVVMDDHFDIVP